MRPLDDTEKTRSTEVLPSRQDRVAYRIETSLFLVRLQPLYAPSPSLRRPRLLNVTLSTAGIGLREKGPLKPHQWMLLEFALPTEPDRILHTQTRVIHSVPMEDGTYSAGLEFMWLSAEDGDRVRAYCQAEQRALLRQRLEEEDLE